MDINSTLQKMSDRLKKLEQRVNSSRISDAGGGYWMSMGPYKSTPPGTAGSPYEPFIVSIPRDMTLKRIVQGFAVTGTNNTSHYWTFTYQTLLSSIGTISSNNSPLGNNSLVLSSFSASTLSQSADVYIYVTLAATGNPGNIHWYNPSIFFI